MIITIGVPYAGHGISPSWAVALKRLIIPGNYHIHIVRGHPIDVARNYIVELALRERADYVFFLDSDVIPRSPDVLVRLLSWKLPVVSGIYALKRPPFKLCIFRKKGEKLYEPMGLGEIPPGVPFVEMDAAGAGCLLVHTKIFRMMEKPWFKWDIEPWSDEPGLSEDIYFTSRVKEELGIEMYADISAECLHAVAPGIALNVRGEFETIL